MRRHSFYWPVFLYRGGKEMKLEFISHQRCPTLSRSWLARLRSRLFFCFFCWGGVKNFFSPALPQRKTCMVVTIRAIGKRRQTWRQTAPDVETRRQTWRQTAVRHFVITSFRVMTLALMTTIRTDRSLGVQSVTVNTAASLYWNIDICPLALALNRQLFRLGLGHIPGPYDPTVPSVSRRR